MKLQVMFINPLIVVRDGRFLVDGPTYVGALARNTLQAQGIECDLPIRQPFDSRTAPEAFAEMMARVMRCCRPDCLNVIGVTNWASTALNAMILMHHVREQCEALGIPLLIIAGGPFFVRDPDARRGEGSRDSIEATLRWRRDDGAGCPYDGVVYGGLSALVELVRALQANGSEPRQYRIERLPTGYYVRDGNAIRGSGRSEVVELTRPPLIVTEKPHGIDVTAMFSTGCSNGCDYCRLGEKHRFTAPQIGEAFRQLAAGTDIRRRFAYLKLLDPNPFSGSNARHTAACLQEVRSVLGFAPLVHCYYDPRAFADPDRVLEETARYNIRRIFVGREAIGEPGLSFIGRRYRGRLRTEAMVEEEAVGLERFIRKWKQNDLPLRLTISYILSPVETVTSLHHLLSDMQRWLALSEGRVQTHVQWELLWPNPGTRVMERYRSLITDEVYFAMNASQTWKPEAIAESYPAAVSGRANAWSCDRVPLDARGLQQLITQVT